MSYAFADGTLIDRSRNMLVSGTVGTALEDQWLAPGAQKLREVERTQLHYALQELAGRGENWDGRGSRAADGRSIFEALIVLDAALQETEGLGFNWAAPHLGLDELGHVVMEWWSGHKKLTIYIVPDQSEYLCSWGQNVEQQMDSGLLGPGEFQRHWRWLWTLHN